MEHTKFICPNCGEIPQESVLFLCNRCKQEDLILKDDIYLCPSCLEPGENFQCLNCDSMEVKMAASKKVQSGLISPIFIMLVFTVIALSFGGFLLISRKASDTTFEPQAAPRASLCSTAYFSGGGPTFKELVLTRENPSQTLELRAKQHVDNYYVFFFNLDDLDPQTKAAKPVMRSDGNQLFMMGGMNGSMSNKLAINRDDFQNIVDGTTGNPVKHFQANVHFSIGNNTSPEQVFSYPENNCIVRFSVN